MEMSKRTGMKKNQIDLARDWVDYTIGTWLAPDEIVSLPMVDVNVEMALARLDDAWNKKEVKSTLEQIKRIKNDNFLEPLETGVAFLCCGQVLVEMGSLNEAEGFLRDAIVRTPRSYAHFLAVLNWLLGTIYWLKESKRSQASNHWNDTMDFFTSIARDGGTAMNKKAWYEKQIGIMQTALRFAIQRDELPPLDPVIIPGVILPPPPPVVFAIDAMDTDFTRRRTRWSRRTRTISYARRTKRTK